MRSRFIILAVALVAAATTAWVLLRHDDIRHAAPCQGSSSPQPTAGHPRLLVGSGDLDRLRSFAVDSNRVYAAGVAAQARQAEDDMDAGRVPGADKGTDAYVEYPTESYAELFAFMSLVAPDKVDRDDYGRRACSLIMDVLR